MILVTGGTGFIGPHVVHALRERDQPVRAQSEQVVRAPTVFVSHNLPSDAITGFTVSCPGGYVAASGGVSSPGSGATLLSIRPVGLSGFTFRFGIPATNDVTRATVAVACR